MSLAEEASSMNNGRAYTTGPNTIGAAGPGELAQYTKTPDKSELVKKANSVEIAAVLSKAGYGPELIDRVIGQLNFNYKFLEVLKYRTRWWAAGKAIYHFNTHLIQEGEDLMFCNDLELSDQLEGKEVKDFDIECLQKSYCDDVVRGVSMTMTDRIKEATPVEYRGKDNENPCERFIIVSEVCKYALKLKNDETLNEKDFADWVIVQGVPANK